MGAPLTPSRALGVVATWTGERCASRFESAELLKWLGAFFMLVEHVATFCFDIPDGVTHALGRLAFPLFLAGLVLTTPGTRALRVERTAELALRLAFWGALAQCAGFFVRGLLPLNVLFTFSAGAGLVWCCASRGVWRFPLAVLIVGAGWFCEFGWAGVGVVAITMRAANAFVDDVALRDTRSQWVLTVAGWAAGLSFGAVNAWNGNVWACFALVVVAVVLRLGVGLPRVRHVFYWVYVAQWLFFGAYNYG